MKKKTINIILLFVILALGSALVTWYFVNPTTFVYYRDIVWDFVNKPLPVVGVSVLTISGFVVYVIKSTDIGKKGLNELKKQHNLIIEEKNKVIEQKDKYINELESYKQLVLDNKELIYKIIDILPNKKLKELKDEENNEREN